MTITYDILVDDENGHPEECLSERIESIRVANQELRFYRPKYPAAYLVKCVQTRCREQGAFSPRRRPS
jgi:hypothetical protein